MHSTRVLALIALLVELVHSFSWDIVVGRDTQLEFYNKDGTLTHTQVIPSAGVIRSITYDPVHYRVLFADEHGPYASIFSFDVSTKTVQYLVATTTFHCVVRVVYDPVTQALYWMEGPSIHTFSLNPACSNRADGNLLVRLDHSCWDLAVDSCGGYIYWITEYEIERARLDGSEREVLIAGQVYFRLSLAIDQQTQKIYWTEQTHSGGPMSLESANFNGKNRTTLYIVRNNISAFSLAVSKDFIYWQNYKEQGIWRLPKYSTQTVPTKLTSTSNSSCEFCHRIATSYTIKEQIQGIKSCDAFQVLIPCDSKSETTASVCQNYCIQGECSVGAEGQPTCSCKTGYAGERCEVNMCCHEFCLNGGVCSLGEEDMPAFQDTADFDGGRCEASANRDNSSDAGNSGKETVSACHQFCLNDGACSLNEASAPVCQCTADYVGERCDVPASIANWVFHAYNIEPPVTQSDAVESASTVV